MSWIRQFGVLVLLVVVGLSGCCHSGRCSSRSGCSSCSGHAAANAPTPIDTAPTRLASAGR